MDSNIDDSFFGVVSRAIINNVYVTDEQLTKIFKQITRSSGGDVIYISKQHNLKLSVRNDQLKKDHASGITKSQLETKYLLSRHQINRILKA